MYAAGVRVKCNKITIFPALVPHCFAIVINHSQGSYQSGGSESKLVSGDTGKVQSVCTVSIYCDLIGSDHNESRIWQTTQTRRHIHRSRKATYEIYPAHHQNHIYFRLEMTMIVEELRV